VRLGPDLGPGTHLVRIQLVSGPERAWARFFVTGRADHSPGLRAHVEWEGD
jgi:hypothetical protein